MTEKLENLSPEYQLLNNKTKDTAIFEDDVRFTDLACRDSREPLRESRGGFVRHGQVILGRRQRDLCSGEINRVKVVHWNGVKVIHGNSVKVMQPDEYSTKNTRRYQQHRRYHGYN